MFTPNDRYKIRAYDELLAALAAATKHQADHHTDERTPEAVTVGWEPQMRTDSRGFVRVSIDLVYSLPEDPAHPEAGQGLIQEGTITCGIEVDDPLMTGEWFSWAAQAWNEETA